MEIGLIIHKIGTFLSISELFIYSEINKAWFENLKQLKKKECIKTKKEIFTAHWCNNLCPCSIEQCNLEFLIQNFKFKRLFCHVFNKTEPSWLHKYIRGGHRFP